MTADTYRPPAVRTHGALTLLAWMAARRYLVHPVHLAGLGLILLGAALGAAGTPTGSWDGPLVTELYLGVGGIFVGASLARRDQAADVLLVTAPVERSTRTVALFAACAVPAVTAVLTMALGAGLEHVRPLAAEDITALRPSNGEITQVEYLTTLLESGPVAAFGGAALGVMIGRRFLRPGAAVVGALGLFLIEMVVLGAAADVPGAGETWPVRAIAAALPWTFWFVEGDALATGAGVMRPGSPVGHLFYAVALCGLVVVDTLRSESAGRDLRAATVALTALALGGYLGALLG